MNYPKIRKKRTKIENCVGNTYNFLTVIQVIQKPVKSLFLCRCVCGNEKTHIASDVINGNAKSCGCKRKELFKKGLKLAYEKNFPNPVENKIYSSYKSQAKNIKRDFLITLEEFIKLVNENCHYCGETPLKLRHIANKLKEKPLNGIDRVDNSIGYLIDNCVPCCTTCNFMKKMLTKEDFLNQINKIYKFTHND